MHSLANPMHPGTALKELYMEPSNIGVVELSKMIGVSQSTVSRLVSGKSDLSCSMAIRLSKVFKRTPEGWLNMQIAFTLSQLKNKPL
jgi:addiction module HigA family antidote